ncbi:MAG: hypothetical protein HUJ52_04265, partial [Malacoplasma sp.]|nr:hypothetical protein [Malacoplasma sp.]
MNSNNNANKVDLPLKNDLPQENNNAEEVNLKTTKITATDKIFFESNNDVGQQQSFWRRNKRICICSIILFALCVCITRVPFVGSYLDAFVFDYLWGCAKYIIYLWGIILCVVTMFNPHFTRSLFKPKMIVIQIFCIFACSLIFSAVTHWANPDLTNVQVDEGYFKTVMENYHSNHFLEYIQGSSQYHYAYSSTSTWWMDIYYKVNDKFYTFVGGGLIGELCVGLGYLFIILFAVSLVAFCVISIISARSPAAALAIQKFFSKLFGNKRIKGKQNELEVEKNDIKVAEVSSEEIKKEIATNSDETPPIRFLTDTSVDNYAINKDRAEKVKYGISAFCKQHAITPKQFNFSI